MGTVEVARSRIAVIPDSDLLLVAWLKCLVQFLFQDMVNGKRSEAGLIQRD